MKRIHKCTICGNEGHWDDNWTWFGSLDHQDTCPEDLPNSCSEPCRLKLEKKIDSKEFVLPVISSHGYNSHVVEDKKGY